MRLAAARREQIYNFTLLYCNGRKVSIDSREAAIIPNFREALAAQINGKFRRVTENPHRIRTGASWPGPRARNASNFVNTDRSERAWWKRTRRIDTRHGKTELGRSRFAHGRAGPGPRLARSAGAPAAKKDSRVVSEPEAEGRKDSDGGRPAL